MASQDRDLVAGLRAEVAAVEPPRRCDRRAEMAGLGTAVVRGDRPALARLIVRLGRDEEPGARVAFDWARAAEHCRIAFLRGRFLARGSLSLTGGHLHLEFVVPLDEAPVLAAQLAILGPAPAVRARRGRGVVTWKSAEAIGTFLRVLGANASLLEIELRQVARSVRGDLNRLINAESANLERIVSASARQLGAIAALEDDGRLATLPEPVREIARARVATPEASLSELAADLQLPRGRVQRALERLELLALHPSGPPDSEPVPNGTRHTGRPPRRSRGREWHDLRHA